MSDIAVRDENGLREATVYYTVISEPRRQALNGPEGDWSKWGWSRAFAELTTVGSRSIEEEARLVEDAIALDLYEPAARMKARGAEGVFCELQNLTHGGWAAKRWITPLTSFTRSMSVGDVIVWDDGQAELCRRVGFADLGRPVRIRFLERSRA
jgi:hypothetical protein